MRDGDDGLWHDTTLSLVTGGDAYRNFGVASHLFLVMQAKREREAPLRISLRDLDEVKLSRTAERCIELGGEGAARSLRAGIADNWMSLDHATLVRQGERWKVRDYASKNGTKVNGQRRRTATLRDGDVLEMGRTFFVFRAEQATPLDAPQWLDGREAEVLPGLGTMISALADRFDALTRLAATSAPILIGGPTGYGKELLARAVHMLSGRRGQFVAVSCAELSEATAERELFGIVRPALGGAIREERGLIAASTGGTLFLDEIADLSPAMQGRLLRVLQERAVRPLGATAEVRLDLRVVAATRKDLVRLVEHGQFRYDLLDRLGSLFSLPALCERREDLGLIIEAILERIAGPRARDLELSVEAMRGFMLYSWPGDVRELQTALERAVALAEPAPVEIHHLPAEIQRSVVEVLHRPDPSNQLADRSPGALLVPDDALEDRLWPGSASVAPYAYDAFVSYRRDAPADGAWVEQVMVPRLEQLGLRLCLEHRDFRLAQPRIREMERAVASSRYTVAVLTPSYLDGGFEDLHVLLSQHQSWETRVARFIPVMRRTCQPPLGARTTSLLDLRRDPEVDVGLQRLARELRKQPQSIRDAYAGLIS
jgi:hypothetical protein